MKLMFVSDIHGCLTAAQTALDLFKQSQADHLILLGDILNHGPRNPVPKDYQPSTVADLLNQYQDKIIAVRGNCDSEVDQMLLSFPMMSDYAFILLENGGKLFLTHGHKYNAQHLPPAISSANTAANNTAANIDTPHVLCHGHTHIPTASIQNGVFIFNPGSITFPKADYPASVGYFQENQFWVEDLQGQRLSVN